MEAATAIPSNREVGAMASSARLLRSVSDERLVRMVREGSEAAFEAVYDRYHRPLLSFCRHMLGQAEEGADALQQTFISAHQALMDSGKPVELRPWLFAIARNRCLTMLRVRHEHANVEDFQPATEGLAVEVQRRQDLRDVLADLAELPDNQRAALVLAEIGSLSHREVAAAIDVREDNVKGLVYQARSSLLRSRAARAMPCAEIREQMSTLTGGALRRGPLRNHLRQCAGCREFRTAVRDQRQTLALLLPVLPAAHTKQGVLSAIFGSGSGGIAAGSVIAGGGAGLTLASTGIPGLAIKALIAVAVIGGGAAVATHSQPSSPAAHPNTTSAPASVFDALLTPTADSGPGGIAASALSGPLAGGSADGRLTGASGAQQAQGTQLDATKTPAGTTTASTSSQPSSLPQQAGRRGGATNPSAGPQPPAPPRGDGSDHAASPPTSRAPDLPTHTPPTLPAQANTNAGQTNNAASSHQPVLPPHGRP